VTPSVLVAIQTGAFVLFGASTLQVCRRRGAPVARAILAGGLAAGASMHLVALAEDGLLAFPEQPVAFNLFWASLAILDPLAALLLNVRPRAGIALTLAIMLLDVSVNTAAFGQTLLAGEGWRLWAQASFGLFAVAAARRVWAAEPGRLAASRRDPTRRPEV
jgi:hypothetical protein